MKVAEREQAIPYDVPNVELGHHGDQCSFDAFLPSTSSRIRPCKPSPSSCAAATPTQRQLTPESPGLYALATGFQATNKDDVDNMARQFPAYDALYVLSVEAVRDGGRHDPRARR